jgi:hypothetical protein
MAWLASAVGCDRPTGSRDRGANCGIGLMDCSTILWAGIRTTNWPCFYMGHLAGPLELMVLGFVMV